MKKIKNKIIRNATEEEKLLKRFGEDIADNMKTDNNHREYWNVRHNKLKLDIESLVNNG